MEMGQAFNVMLGSLYSKDAGRAQVNGVLAWRETAMRAAALAAACGHRAVVTGATETPRHRLWVSSCEAIIAALRGMESIAEQVQIAAAENAAAAERDRDSLLQQAVAVTEPAARLELMRLAMHAERARRKAQGLALTAGNWWVTADDAAGQGVLLVRGWDRVLAPVVKAVADAGGLPEVAQDKTYHSL